MYWPDFKQYVAMMGNPAVTTPTSANTLFWQGRIPAPISNITAVSVSFDALGRQLVKMRSQHIVFIGQFFHLPAAVPADIENHLDSLGTCDFFVLNPVWPQT
jgi:hypothetical protein